LLNKRSLTIQDLLTAQFEETLGDLIGQKNNFGENLASKTSHLRCFGSLEKIFGSFFQRSKVIQSQPFSF